MLLMTHVACCVTCCAAYLTAYWKWLHQLPNFKFQEPNRTQPTSCEISPHHLPEISPLITFCSHRSSPVTAPVWSQPVFGCPKKTNLQSMQPTLLPNLSLSLRAAHHAWISQIGITRHGGAANRSSQLSSFEKSNLSTTLRLGISGDNLFQPTAPWR